MRGWGWRTLNVEPSVHFFHEDRVYQGKGWDGGEIGGPVGSPASPRKAYMNTRVWRGVLSKLVGEVGAAKFIALCAKWEGRQGRGGSLCRLVHIDPG